MKKLVVGLVTALLITMGLIEVVGTSANADPYPGTVVTSLQTKSRPSVRKTHHFSVKVDVLAASNVNPTTGSVTCTIFRKKGGFSVTQTQPETGARLKFRTDPLNKVGYYKFTCTYTPVSGSVYKPSSAKGKFKVRPGHA